MSLRRLISLTTIASSILLAPAAETPVIAVPGTVVWSSIGNSLDARGAMRDAEWVQQMVNEIEVSPDGTVLAASFWDEQGRCIGLYKDGRTHRTLLGQYNRIGGHKCWGYGTGNKASALDGKIIYCINDDKQLLRFDWTPGNLESHVYRDQVEVGKEAFGLSARNGVIVAVYGDGTVERRRDAAMGSVEATVTIPGAIDAAVTADGHVWILINGVAAEYDAKLQATGRTAPTDHPLYAINITPDGCLITCDAGPRQQVRIYKTTGKITLDRAIGQDGGFRAGTPGQPAPDKFGGLRGANSDAAGNLYVAMCFADNADGNTILRSFTPEMKQRWELVCHHFSETVALESAGSQIRAVGKTVNMLVDPVTRAWQVETYTYDPSAPPDLDRIHRCGVQLRTIGGKRFSFVDHMVGDQGFAIFAQPAVPTGLGFAPRVGELGGDAKDSWSWYLDTRADLWSAVAADRTIQHLPSAGLLDGKPVWDEAKRQRQPWPEGWGEICRLHYDVSTDALYVAGYPTGIAPKSWGLIGSAMACYDHWSSGKPVQRWINLDLPVDNEGYPPKSMTVAGNHIFVVPTRERLGRRAVAEVHAGSTGRSVGSLIPPDEVGKTSGWVDMRSGIAALHTTDGKYHIAIEDNNGGRQHFVTWTPATR